MSNKNIVSLLKELGTALNVQNIGELVNETTDFENVDVKDLASKFIAASNAKVEGVMKNYLSESEKVKQLEQSIKDEIVKAKDEGYKSAKRNFAEKTESLIKTKFGLADSKAERFEDLIDELHAKVNASSNEPKNDKVFLELQSKLAELTKENESVKKSKEEEIERMKSEFEKEKVYSKVADLGISRFLSLNPILSDNEVKKANQLNIVKENLLKHNWKIDGDNVILLDKDGNPAIDDNFNVISFDKAVENITGSIFDFNQSVNRASPNSNNVDNGASNTGALTFAKKRPENEKELLELANDPDLTLEQQKEVMQYGLDKGIITL